MLDRLLDRVDQRDFIIGIVSLGYVGLQLTLTGGKGFCVFFTHAKLVVDTRDACADLPYHKVARA